MTSPRVLILTARCGNGHVSAAKAIQVEAETRGWTSHLQDCLDLTPKAFRTWYGGGYEMVVKTQKHAWGYLYKISDYPNAVFWLQTVMDTVFMRCLRLLERDFRPDWVVCAHSLPQPYLRRLQRMGRPFRQGIVVTDLHPHRMWLRGHPQRFFLPTDWTWEQMALRAPRADARVTGIPIHSAFSHLPTKPEARKQFGLSEGEPWLLLTSGGIGGGPMAQAVDALRNHSGVLAVCGRNDRMRQLLQARYEQDHKVKVVGHLTQHEMAAAMSACDLMVAKPGGLTTFEVLACAMPFLVYMPFLIPGQEEHNARFLAETGAGVLAWDPDELSRQARELLCNQHASLKMRIKAKSLARPQAAAHVLDGLLD